MTSKSTSRSDTSHIGRTITMRPSKITSLIDVLNSTKHVGSVVDVAERMRWVRKPGVEEGGIVWWPGILYKGFLELMVDLDYRLPELRAGCLVQHNRTKSTKPTVVYLLGATPPFARSIAYVPTPSPTSDFGLDEEGRDGPDVKNFYDQYEEMARRADEAEADEVTKERFRGCVEFAERILCCVEDVGGEGEGDGVGSLLVIKDGGGGGVSPHGVGGERSAVVAHPAGLDPGDVDETESRFSLTQRSVVETQPPLKITVTADSNNTNNKDDDCKGHRFDGTPETALSSVQAEDMGSPLSEITTINWKTMWGRLAEKGWTVVRAGKFNTLHNWYYIRPDCDPGDPDCVLGVHYFKEPEDVYEHVRAYRSSHRRHFHNKGDDYHSVKQDSPFSSVTSHSKSPSEASSVNTETIDLVDDDAEWIVLWQQLQGLGWHWNFGKGIVEHVYIKPGKTLSGSLGKDFFHSKADVIKYVKTRKKQSQDPAPYHKKLNSNVYGRKRKHDEVKRYWGSAS